MKVWNVIPCYNDKNTIEKVVDPIRNAPLESREIIVVGTIARKTGRSLYWGRGFHRMVDRIFCHPVNRSKSADLRGRDWSYLSKLVTEDEP